MHQEVWERRQVRSTQLHASTKLFGLSKMIMTRKICLNTAQARMMRAIVHVIEASMRSCES